MIFLGRGSEHIANFSIDNLVSVDSDLGSNNKDDSYEEKEEKEEEPAEDYG